MTNVQKTYLQNPDLSQRADLNKIDFDKKIVEKGRTVLLEKAIKCPCKGKAINQLSSCKNCGGTGWSFVNPTSTRMLLQGLDVVTKEEGWSEELRGMVSVTALSEEQLSYMDRITDVDGESIYSEVLQFKKSGSTIFSYTSYAMKKILYIALYQGPDTGYRRLSIDIDYTAINNVISLLNIDPQTDVRTLSVTVRYQHSPTFHVLEMKRDTMQSFKLLSSGSEQKQMLPVSAYARRAHYQLDASNLAGDRLISNSYTESTCNDEGVNVPSQIITGPVEFSEIDPIWQQEKVNYYTKSELQQNNVVDLPLTVTITGQTDFNIFNNPTGKTNLIIGNLVYFKDIHYTIEYNNGWKVKWGNSFPLDTTDEIIFRTFLNI